MTISFPPPPAPVSHQARRCRAVKQRLATAGRPLFALLASPSGAAAEGVLAIVREVLCLSPAAAWPIRDAALEEGVIVKHLLAALRPLSGGGARSGSALLSDRCLRED